MSSYRLIYITFLILIATLSHGHTGMIHVFIVQTMEATDLSEAATVNAKRMHNVLMELSKKTDMNIAFYELHTNISQATFDSLLQQACVDKNDVTFLYYMGHAVNDQKSQWPILLPPSAQPIHFIDMHQQVVKKSARFHFSMCECCNIGTRSPKNRGIQARGRGSNVTQSIQNLFKYSQGNILMVGASVGEYSWFQHHIGSFFTLSFEQVLHRSLSENTLTTWADHLERISELTRKNATVYLKQQKPIFSINVNNIVNE